MHPVRPRHRFSRSPGLQFHACSRAQAATARAPACTRVARRAAETMADAQIERLLLPSQPYRSHEMSEFITSRLGPRSCAIGSLPPRFRVQAGEQCLHGPVGSEENRHFAASQLRSELCARLTEQFAVNH